MCGQQFLQRAGAAGVAAGYPGIAASGFLQGGTHHFMRNSIGEQDDQIRKPQLPLKVRGHFGKNLCPASIAIADLFILALHSFVAADDDNTHDETSSIKIS